jgi:hypothetical protein
MKQKARCGLVENGTVKILRFIIDHSHPVDDRFADLYVGQLCIYWFSKVRSPETKQISAEAVPAELSY